MNPVVYQASGVMAGGRYLPGQYRWAVGVRLESALVECVPPSEGVLSLELEVAGALTGFSIEVGAGVSPVSRLVPLGLLVGASETVRWYASYDGTPDAAASGVSVTLVPVEQSISEVTGQASVLDLRMAGGIPVASYAASTAQWTVTETGTALGVTISGGTDWVLSWTAGELLRAQGSGSVKATQFFVGGGTAGPRTEARLQFCINGQPVLGVSATGVRVPELVEEAVVTVPGGAHFEFWGGGLLVGVLDGQGLRVLAGVEP